MSEAAAVRFARCRSCERLSRVAPLPSGTLARCPRCGAVLARRKPERVDLEEESLEFGVSVDVNALERSGLVEEEMLERVLGILPMLRGREIYVAFRGVPGVADGKIALVEDLEVSLGFLTLPIDDFAEKLGFSVETAYSKLKFDLGWFYLEELRAGKDEMILEVRVR